MYSGQVLILTLRELNPLFKFCCVRIQVKSHLKPQKPTHTHVYGLYICVCVCVCVCVCGMSDDILSALLVRL